ncbi:hypothetical protein C8R45DRAFT_927037 [Mycena sanguinolenta]|nr:hypothetical protein C8R45DRAFT_927037 [Mycena sanguinolenta]
MFKTSIANVYQLTTVKFRPVESSLEVYLLPGQAGARAHRAGWECRAVSSRKLMHLTIQEDLEMSDKIAALHIQRLVLDGPENKLRGREHKQQKGKTRKRRARVAIHLSFTPLTPVRLGFEPWLDLLGKLQLLMSVSVLPGWEVESVFHSYSARVCPLIFEWGPFRVNFLFGAKKYYNDWISLRLSGLNTFKLWARGSGPGKP